MVSTLLIWVASSPSLRAYALTKGPAPSGQVAAPASTVVQPRNTQTSADREFLTAPVALLLQGIVFLACGFLWPKEPKSSPSTISEAVVVPGIEHLQS